MTTITASRSQPSLASTPTAPSAPTAPSDAPTSTAAIEDLSTLMSVGLPAASFDPLQSPLQSPLQPPLPQTSSTLAGALGQSTYGKQAPSLDSVRDGSATLKLGMTGESVRELQQKLNDAGAVPQLATDGELGPRTEAALKKFQKQSADGEIKPTGALDSATLNALEQCRERPIAPALSSAVQAARPALDLGDVKPGALAGRVADSAIAEATTMKTVGYCAKGVNHALQSQGVMGAGNAYQKAEQLAHDPRFTEVNVDKSELSQLPRGAVVVWGKGGDVQYGHVSVALGDGREASDHIQKQMTKGPGGFETDYGLGPTGKQFRVFIPTAD